MAVSLPVAEQYLRQAEEKLGCRFPQAYVRRMTAANGGVIRLPGQRELWELYPIWDTSDKKRLKKTFNDVVRATEQLRISQGFPTGAVAIGSSLSGDAFFAESAEQLIFLPTGGSDIGLNETVYRWDHTLPGEALELAQSFAEFEVAEGY